MTTDRDRILIGRIVEREMSRRLGSWPALDRASGVSRSTLYRLREGDPAIKQSVLARVERALDLPFDTLNMAAVHDFQGLLDIGVPAELVDWIVKESAKTTTERTHRDTKAV